MAKAKAKPKVKTRRYIPPEARRGRGRPPTYHPDMAREAEILCRKGCTDLEIAQFFQVDVLTIWRWKNRHEEFSKALTRGKEVADALVERMHFERAVGYNFKASKIFLPAGSREPVIVDYIEHVPPDVPAQKNWLSNRDPERWHRSGDDGGRVDPEAAARQQRVIDAMVGFIKAVTPAAPAPHMLDVTPKKKDPV